MVHSMGVIEESLLKGYSQEWEQNEGVLEELVRHWGGGARIAEEP